MTVTVLPTNENDSIDVIFALDLEQTALGPVELGEKIFVFRVVQVLVAGGPRVGFAGGPRVCARPCPAGPGSSPSSRPLSSPRPCPAPFKVRVVHTKSRRRGSCSPPAAAPWSCASVCRCCGAVPLLVVVGRVVAEVVVVEVLGSSPLFCAEGRARRRAGPVRAG